VDECFLKREEIDDLETRILNFGIHINQRAPCLALPHGCYAE